MMLLLGSWFLFVGVTDWKNQHSGVPARMTVSKCTSGKHSACWGAQPDTMPQTVDDPSHPGQTMEIQVHNPDPSNIKIRDAGDGDVGHEIAVHVHYGRYGTRHFCQQGRFGLAAGLDRTRVRTGHYRRLLPCASPTERPAEWAGVNRTRRFAGLG